MKCTETGCTLNCFGYCQNISAIKDHIEFDIPEPDGCPNMAPKNDLSQE